MKMKGFLCLLLLALVALPILAACSSPSPATTSAKPAATAPATTAAVINLKYSSGYVAVDTTNIICNYFMDYVEKQSNGRVKFERFYSSLGTPAEQFGLINSNSVDVVQVGQLVMGNTLPLYFYGLTKDTTPEIIAAQKKLWFEIPESSAILTGALAKNNAKLLNFFPTGTNGIIAKQAFSSFADLKGKKVGTGLMGLDALKQLGMNPVSLQPADMYESLSRGVIDAISYPAMVMIALKFYEVSKCFMSQTGIGASQLLLVNTNSWNKLPADIQKIFTDAVPLTEKFAIETDKTNAEKNLKIFKDAGLTVGVLPQADSDAMNNINYTATMKTYLANCEKAGLGEQAKVIQKYLDQLYNGK
jgi:TRAP-type C4-dicarboxylate transport system substrate-binding protein